MKKRKPESEPQRLLGYVRCSTEEQAQSGLGLEAQRERIAAYVTAQGADLAGIEADEGVSGTVAPNPRTGKRWSHGSLWDTWIKAQESVGIHNVAFYQATKHSFATDALRRGVPKHLLQAFLGHTDVRSTDRYARLAQTELVTVLRPRDLSPTCRQGVETPESVERKRGVMASPAGVEPASPP